MKKYKNSVNTDNIVFRGDLICGMVFTTDQEKMLNNYRLTVSSINYGFTGQQFRKLGY